MHGEAKLLWIFFRQLWQNTNIYLYTHNSTNAKMRILNKVFDAYGKDKNDLVFNLKPEK